MPDTRRVHALAREIVDEFEPDAGDVARVLVIAMRRPEVLRSPNTGKPSAFLRRASSVLERYERLR